MCEGEASPSFIGKISKLRFRGNEIVIHFEKIQDIPEFQEGVIPANALSLDINEFEFHRTHWAIKDVDIYGVLSGGGVLTQKQVLSGNIATGNIIDAKNLPPSTPNGFNDQQIFIVHGHDDLAKNDVRNYVENIEKEKSYCTCKLVAA